MRSFKVERAVLANPPAPELWQSEAEEEARGGVGSSRGRGGVSPLVQPVTETKCGPWLHWHRGQSSRSHTHWAQAHTHAYGYAARRYSTAHRAVTQRGPHGRCKTQVLDTTQLTQILTRPSHQVEQAHKPCRTPPARGDFVSSRSGITSFRVAHLRFTAAPLRSMPHPPWRPDAAEALSRSPRAGGQLPSHRTTTPRFPARPCWASAISSDRAWHRCSVISPPAGLYLCGRSLGTFGQL